METASNFTNYPQPPRHPADKDAPKFSDMTWQELQIEAQRLNRLAFDSNSETTELKGAFERLLKDLSGPIFAHMRGDTKALLAGFDILVEKYVTVTGDHH